MRLFPFVWITVSTTLCVSGSGCCKNVLLIQKCFFFSELFFSFYVRSKWLLTLIDRVTQIMLKILVVIFSSNSHCRICNVQSSKWWRTWNIVQGSWHHYIFVHTIFSPYESYTDGVYMYVVLRYFVTCMCSVLKLPCI